MSMPFRIIRCDKCDFEAYSSCIWGEYSYVSPDGSRLNVNRTYGWCYSCQDIRPVEDLSDEEKVKNDTATDIQSIADIRRTNLLGKLLQLLGKDRWQISNLKKDINNNKRRLAFLHERKSAPKCLTCSSTEIKKISIPTPQGDNVETIEDLQHPNCGGNLLVQNSQWWINVGLRTKEYDLDGRLLEVDDYH